MPPEDEEILQASSEQIQDKAAAKVYIKLQLGLAPADDKLVKFEVTKTGHVYEGVVFVRA